MAPNEDGWRRAPTPTNQKVGCSVKSDRGLSGAPTVAPLLARNQGPIRHARDGRRNGRRSSTRASQPGLGKSSVIVNQGAMSSVKMCRSGRIPGSSSSTPASILNQFQARSTSGGGTCEPQRLQKQTRYRGGASKIGAS